MAKDSRKRQAKLERRKAKDKVNRKVLTQRSPRDVSVRLERSAAAPILHCCTTNVLWDQGIANVLVSRELNSGNVAFVAFLVDMYCLGVKDVTFDVAPRARYDWQVYGKLFRNYGIINLKPEAARRLVEGAVEYAMKLGLPPHRDYRKAKLIFGDIEVDSCTTEFVYGKDGKPFFIAGPHDSPSRCRRIMSILTDRCGPDGFHYLMPLGGTGEPPPGTRVLAIDDHGEIKEESY